MISRRDVVKLGAAGLIAPSPRAVPDSSPAVLAEDSSDRVAMFRGNAARTGEMPGPAPSLDEPIVVKWQFYAAGLINSSPAVVDGRVYFGSYRSTGKFAPKKEADFHAIDVVTGQEHWSISCGGVATSSPAVSNGTVFFGSQEGEIYAVEGSTGQEKWRFATGSPIFSSPAVVDGTVFIGGHSDNVYALDATSGEEIWRFNTGADVLSSPAISGDIVFIGSYNKALHAIDSKTGTELWRFDTNDPIRVAPAVFNGTVYVGTEGRRRRGTYALDASSGKVQWSTDQTGMASSPAVTDDLLVYVWDDLRACDPGTGTESWRIDLESSISSPVICDNTVFIGGSDQNFYAFDASTGETLWRFSTGGIISSSPAVSDGMILVGSEDGYVHALGNLLPLALKTDVVVRAAPSNSGVSRGTASAGIEIEHLGAREEREGEVWVEITINGTTGWIPLEAIDPVTLPPEGEIEYVYIPE